MTAMRIVVVGGGQMGSGIAEAAARAGADVLLAEVDAALAAAAGARVERSLAKAVDSGKASPEQRDSALSRLRVTDSLEEAAGAELVLEAIVEDEHAKCELFARLATIAGDRTVLATNTSSIPVTRIARASGRPEAVIGIHFFNPVPVMPLVELVPTALTAETTRERARAFAEDVLGKQAVWSRDRAGFVVNALLIPFLLSAIRMVEAGFATAEDVDLGMVAGCGHPMGPLALADLIGLDTTLAIAETLHAELAEPQYAPPPLLRRNVEAGLLGRKSGRGFYSYST